MTHMLVDLSHTIEHGMTTYKGLPPPVISDYLSREHSREHYATGTEFQIGKIEMVANTGTYLDSPFHRYENGKDLADLELSTLANLEGVLVHCESTSASGTDGDKGITAKVIQGLDIARKAVLFHTGWDAFWRTERYADGTHPYLTAEAAEYLVSAGASLVGIDSYNLDGTADGQRPAHSTLLAHGIPIVEHLCGLNRLPDSGFRFFAVPAKVRDFGSFPVRAFAIISARG